MGESAYKNIGVGDWVVAGTTAEDADYGRIVEIDGTLARVAWANANGITTCDIDREDVDVYGDWSTARDAANARGYGQDVAS